MLKLKECLDSVSTDIEKETYPQPYIHDDLSSYVKRKIKKKSISTYDRAFKIPVKDPSSLLNNYSSYFQLQNP